MTKKMPKTAPFLLKLHEICSTIENTIGFWSENEQQFHVHDPEKFFLYLKKYFEGSPKTFFRQLSYFRFTKKELLPKGFSFRHPNFRKGDLNSLGTIKRIVSNDSMSSVSDDTDSPRSSRSSHSPKNKREEDSLRYQQLEKAIGNLQEQVTELTKTVMTIVGELKRQTHDHHYRPLEPTILGGSRKRGHIMSALEAEADNSLLGAEDGEDTVLMSGFAALAGHLPPMGVNSGIGYETTLPLFSTVSGPNQAEGFPLFPGMSNTSMSVAHINRDIPPPPWWEAKPCAEVIHKAG